MIFTVKQLVQRRRGTYAWGGKGEGGRLLMKMWRNPQCDIKGSYVTRTKSALNNTTDLKFNHSFTQSWALRFSLIILVLRFKQNYLTFMYMKMNYKFDELKCSFWINKIKYIYALHLTFSSRSDLRIWTENYFDTYKSRVLAFYCIIF